MNLLRKLKPFDSKSGHLNVVIDTPKGSRNKYAFDFKINAYKLKTVLPHGTVFPFDFGSIPGTVARSVYAFAVGGAVREMHSRERRGTGTNLDAADSIDVSTGRGRYIRL